MNQLQADKNILRYLGAVESSMAMSDAKARKQLKERVALSEEPIEKAEEYLDEADQKKASLLRSAIDELHLQYVLGRMEGVEKLQEIEKRIEHGFFDMKNSLRKSKRPTEDEAEHLSEALSDFWKKLKLEINLLYYRIELGREAEGTEHTNLKEELAEDARSIAALCERDADQAKIDFELWLQNTRKSVSERAHKVVKGIEHYFTDKVF